MQDEVRRLISAWMKSGPNLLKLLRDNPELNGTCTQGRTFLMPSRDGVAQLGWVPHQGDPTLSPQVAAARTVFATFLVNPLSQKLGGPCARCGDYFLKRTQGQKVFCKRQCGTMSTALSSTRKRREAESAATLRKAEREISKWCKLRGRRPDWKKWVAGEAGVHVKWLTLAVNKGRLLPPNC